METEEVAHPGQDALIKSFSLLGLGKEVVEGGVGPQETSHHRGTGFLGLEKAGIVFLMIFNSNEKKFLGSHLKRIKIIF